MVSESANVVGTTLRPNRIDHSRHRKQAAASTAIRASWRKTGFECKRHKGAVYLIVNDVKSLQTPTFRGVWGFDYHPASLSPQKSSQRWE
jgi:hypothetical protein